MSTRILAVPCLLLLLLSPRAAPQSLDGAWFKVSVSGAGMRLEPDGDVSRNKGKVVAYMHVTAQPAPTDAAPAGFTYTFRLWTQVAGGTWVESQAGAFSTPTSERVMGGDPQEGIVLQVAIPLAGGEAVFDSWLTVHFVAKLTVKRDGQGTLVKAAFRSMGCLIPDGQIDGRPVLGGGKVTGRTVDAEKLPFVVDA